MTTVTTRPFGVLPDGRAVTAYTLTNGAGMQATVLDYGAIIQSVLVPTPGGPVDVVLGYPELEGYLTGGGYLGALVGRNANRLGGAFIQIDGEKIPVTANEGSKQLHGGKQGFDKKLYTARRIEGGVELCCVSPDGEEGFPGELQLAFRCLLDDAGALTLDYSAVSTRDTVVNLTNHSYFNLNGGGSAMQHRLTIKANAITAMDEDSLPTGEFMPVGGTPFDFRQPRTLAERIGAESEQLRFGGGYDHNFVLNKPAGALEEVAVLVGDQSGIRLGCATTCPGMQLYSANFMDANAAPGKGGQRYKNREAVCLETQYFPNANNCPQFPSTVLRAGQTWHEVTVYTFGLEQGEQGAG